MTIRAGVGLITCQRVPGEERTDARLYADALELAVEAEALGFDSVWTSEHHFVDDGYLPSLLPFCAAIAARTDSIRIGTALLLAPLHDPLRLAEDAAVTDLIAEGRLVLGIGLGWREEEFDALGVPLRDRVRRLEEAVSSCRAAWSGGPATGRDGTAVYVRPLPARPGGPPLWIGGLSEPAARRAGRIADGFMATEVTPATFAEQVGWVREAAEDAGRDPDALAFSLHLPTYVHDGDEAAGWREVLPAHHYVGWKYEDMEVARARTSGSAVPPLTSDEEIALREGIVFGDPAEVAATIRSYAEAAGGDLEFIARLYWPGLAAPRQRDLLRRFGTHVLPLLR